MVFFILDREVQRGEPFLKELRFEDTPVSAAEDMTAPADIHIGQIVFILPVLRVQHRIHTGAVGTGGIAENAESRISPCIVGATITLAPLPPPTSDLAVSWVCTTTAVCKPPTCA